MRVVRAERLDSLSDYRITDIDIPEPGPRQILIRVMACGMGYVDALVSLGRYQVKPSLPHIPCQEVAGVVESVGVAAGSLSPGTRVLASVRGGLAEYALAEADTVRVLPDTLTFEQAAGFRTNHITALHGLEDRARLMPGEQLLVLGAAGGVGSVAIQVGRVLGATVIAAASTDEKRQFALAQGAHHVIDVEPDGWRDRLKTICGGKGPDVVFDPVCGPLFEPAFRSLSWRGRHLVVGFVGGPIPALRANLTLMKGAALIGVDVRQFLLLEPVLANAHLATLLQWADAGRISPPVGRVFDFEDYAAALNYAFSGQGLGKTVVRMAAPG